MFHQTWAHLVLLLCWFISETHINAFRCDNGKIIVDHFFCESNGNGGGDEGDCGDGSDEGYGCTGTCGTGRFTCVGSSSRECLSISARCDKKDDCSDGSDEENCVWFSGEEWTPESCALSKGKFFCRDEEECIGLNRMCDGECNCKDCSDENRTSCLKYDDDSCRACSHLCWPTPDGPQCVCNSSNVESNSKCRSKFVNCTGSDSCDQNCLRYDSHLTKCWCFDNFRVVPKTNGSQCRTSVWYGDVLIYSTVSKIKFLNITSDQVEVVKPVVGVTCTALSAARDHVYYSSFENNKSSIFKITHPSEKTREIIETDTLITSLAVDWITENIYFTNNQSVSVCTNSGHLCTQLDCCGINYVVVAPAFGWMYYTEKSIFTREIVIIKSNMDGSEKNVFLDATFHGIVSLAIDEARGTLYLYAENSGWIDSISLHGSDRKTRPVYGKTFSSFTVLDKRLFFVNPKSIHNNIIYSSKTLGMFREYTDSATDFITNLYAYNPLLQDISKIENPCASTSCSGLCLLRPSSSSNNLDFTCTCQNHTSKNKSTVWCKQRPVQTSEEIDSIPKTDHEVTLAIEQFTFTTKKDLGVVPVQRLMPTISTANKSYKSRTYRYYLRVPTTTETRTDAGKNVLENSNSEKVLSIKPSAIQAPQKSHSDGILLGFLIGITLISAVHVVYFVFRKVYWNRNHQRMSVSELAYLQ